MAAQSLAERVLANERLELRHEVVVPAERELELDASLDTGLAQLFEPFDLVPSEIVVGELGERGTTPQRERLTQRRKRIGVLETAGVAEELFEAQRVEIAVVDPNEVAAGNGLDRGCAELFAQLRDEPLERFRSGLRRSPAPQLLDQAVARHRLVRVEEQEREQLPLVSAAEAQRGYSVVNLQRTRIANRIIASPATVSPCARPGKGPFVTAAWALRDRFLGTRLDRPDMEPRRAARREGGRRCSLLGESRSVLRPWWSA